MCELSTWPSRYGISCNIYSAPKTHRSFKMTYNINVKSGMPLSLAYKGRVT
jgi:hypothetical protein